ncbi:pyridoxamine 5'-phosphate oxidase family protein [Nocardioides cavernaquae]|uniref:Pyridoxamine 5'-phosphate oxidase family protein n=1 Tax=Nocardioides cavernaquae TaxID=2321396 RepID=A0A3A5H785_9ACTN|nr:pyridoxamine 5'-phosphate oxidase family protein [Nocardioides cavernaquae]RJS46516.1 pyridoxamine 5'-phosphate oxidase family protein [Nocardioides cavernaquae]
MEFTPEQRALQDQFDSRRIADRIDHLLVNDEIDQGAAAFIESRDMFFLSTVDASGQPSCSYKGGAPGFVRALDAGTLAFPVYDGNGMFISMGNVAATSKVGMLFIDFEHPGRLRVHGNATLSVDDELVGSWPGAIAVVRVAVTEVFPNCPRYIHRMQRVAESPYVPAVGVVPPIPDWKRAEWANDALPANDPARLT